MQLGVAPYAFILFLYSSNKSKLSYHSAPIFPSPILSPNFSLGQRISIHTEVYIFTFNSETRKQAGQQLQSLNSDFYYISKSLGVPAVQVHTDLYC